MSHGVLRIQCKAALLALVGQHLTVLAHTLLSSNNALMVLSRKCHFGTSFPAAGVPFNESLMLVVLDTGPQLFITLNILIIILVPGLP